MDIILSNTKNKWRSQKVKKTFKNRHKNQNKNSFVSTNNTKQCVRERYGYLGSRYGTFDRMVTKNQNIYDCTKYKYCSTHNIQNNVYCYDNEMTPIWTCSKCTYHNIERLSSCFICGTPFYSSANQNNFNESNLYIEQFLLTQIHSKTKRKKVKNKKKIRRRKYNTNEFELYWNGMNKQRKLFKENLQRYTNKMFYKLDEENSKIMFVNTTDYGQILKTSKQLLCEYEILKRQLPTISMLKDQLKDYGSGQLHIKCILQPHLIRNFCARRNNKLDIVFHGTHKHNTNSIIKRGLIVGGTKGVPITNGRGYGKGIYCSPNYYTANGYATGSLFICLVKTNTVEKNHNIWVVPNGMGILPIYVLSLPYTYYCSRYYGGQLIQFIPQWTQINQKNTQRRIKRKWNAYYKLF